jgi:hypothetical protein
MHRWTSLAGVWLQVSYVVLGSLSLLVMLLWWFTQPVLEVTGIAQGQHAADAAYFARVLMISVPVHVAYGQVYTTAAQPRMLPLYLHASFDLAAEVVTRAGVGAAAGGILKRAGDCLPVYRGHASDRNPQPGGGAGAGARRWREELGRAGLPSVPVGNDGDGVRTGATLLQ